MAKQLSFNPGTRASALAETALVASRQAWLAGLGAAAISRDWARHEAGNTFRALARHGSTVERNAIRVLGDRMETSITTATSLWRDARRNVLATMSGVAEAAAAALPQVRLPAFAFAPAAKPRKVARKRPAAARAAKTARRVKRSARKSK